jgi:signal transduction histidine kinase
MERPITSCDIVVPGRSSPQNLGSSAPETQVFSAQTGEAETPEQIARDVFAVQQIQAVPTLLQVLCEITGMRFAAVARVSGDNWTLCAVKDDIYFGLDPGSQLDIETTLCIEAKRSNTPIVIEHASLDPLCCNHHTPKLRKIESYVSVPIILASGRYFGNLCAIDPAPAKVSNAILGMFKRFAALIAMQLDNEIARENAQISLRDELAAGELREQFIAILGHDLRNPLQAIFATSDLMVRKAVDPVITSMAARIKANSRRMSALIDDVLDFARGRLGGGIGLHLTEIENINADLMSVVQELQDGQPDRQILSSIGVTRMVRADVGRVQQVASNLIGNALTHGAPGRAVKVTALADERDFIFEVWNEGEPIPPENVTKVFEPFWRRESSGHREGLGLGLHICSQIVRAHGGKLSVTSTKEAGTTFTARLPLHLLQ